MSYEHIKEIMLSENPQIWNFWTNEIRHYLKGKELSEKYNKARLQLKRELEMRILTEQKHFAEYELLCILLGITEPIDLSNR